MGCSRDLRRPEEYCTILQSADLLYHSKANNGLTGVGFLINRNLKDRIVIVNRVRHKVAEKTFCIKIRYKQKIVQVYAPTTSQSEEDKTNFYNDVEETLGKPSHYTIVTGDFNAQIGKIKIKTIETATGKFGLQLRNERGDTFVEWTTARKYKLVKTMFKKKAGRRLTWKSPNGVTKTEIDYILTQKPDIVTDVTIINQFNFVLHYLILILMFTYVCLFLV